MSFADELRQQTVTDQQRDAEQRKNILAARERYVKSFRYACREAARKGERACKLEFQNNYDANLCNFYTSDRGTVEEVRAYAEEALRQDGFKKLNVSVVRFTSSRNSYVSRTGLMKSLLGNSFKRVTEVFYTLRIEAKW